MRSSSLSLLGGWRAAILPLLAVWISVGSVGVVRGQTTTATFDAEADFTAYGKASSNVTAAWTATGGRDGEGGVSVTRTTGTGAFNGWLPSSVNLTGKSSLSTSVLIHTGAWNNSSTFYLGFVNNAGSPPSGSSTFLDSGSYTGISVRMEYSTSDSGRFRLRLRNKPGASAENGSSEITLQNLNSGANAGTRNQWLRLNLTLVPHPTTANAYNAVATLEKLGTSGSDTPVQIMTTGVNSITNASIFGATAAYPAYNLSIGSSNSGITYLDDHRVTLDAIAPDAPTATAAEVHTTTRLTAKWTAPVGGPVVGGYVLELVKAGDTFEAGNFIAANGMVGQATGIALGSAVTSQAFQGLLRNQAYQYRVRASNPAGTGGASNIIDVTTSDENTPATLSSIVSPPPQYPGDTSSKTVSLTGIGTGGDDDQTLTVTAVSDNQAVVLDGSISITPVANGNATLSYTSTGAAGVANVTVTVKDFTGATEESSVSQPFVVRVQQPPLSYGFDAETDLDEYGQGSSANVAAAWGAAHGAGASGGISVSRTTGSQHAYYNGWRSQPLDLTGKDLIRTTILVNLADFTPSSSTSGVYLGFATNSDDANDAPAGTSASTSFLQANNSSYRAVSAYLGYASGSSGTLSVQVYNKNGTGAASASGSADSQTTFNKNQWVRLSLELTPNGAPDAFTATTIVEGLGPDGTAEPVTLLTSRTTVVNANLFSAQRAYPAWNVYFRDSSSVSGPIRLDEHEASAVTVEPPAPEALEATGITTTNFTANWEPAAFAAAASQGFLVKVVADEADFETGPYYQLDGSLDDDPVVVLSYAARSTVFSGPDCRGESRHYRIVSRNPTGESEESNTVSLALSPDNLPPTLDPLSSPPSIHPGDTTDRSVSLSGITNGGDVGQPIAVTVESSNPSLFSSLFVSYTNPNPGGTLHYTPAGTTGEALVTVKVSDGEDEITRSFTIRVQAPPPYFQFDSAADFDEYGLSTTTNLAYGWDAAGGAGNPAGGGLLVQRTSTSSSATHNGWRLQPFDFAGKSYLQTSILLNMKEWNNTGTLRLGFLTNIVRPNGDPVPGDTSNFLTSGNDYRAVALQMEYSTSSSGRFRMQIHNKATSSGSSNLAGNIDVTNVTPNNYRNNWIRLTLVLVPTGAPNQYTTTVKLENLGPDGLSAPVQLSTGSTTITNVDLATAGQKVYAAYNLVLDSSNTGRTWLDDHEAVASAGAPHAPESLSATGITTTDLTANWRRAATGGYPLNGYVVELTTAEDNFASGTFVAANGATGQSAGVGVASPSAGALAFTGLTLGEDYVYRVRAMNADGPSPWSDVIPVSTSAVNIPPTINPLPPQPSIHPGDTSPRTVNLSGITNGGDAGQPLAVTVESSDPAVVSVSAASYTSPNSTGSFVYTPTGEPGSALLTVTVDDGQDTVTASTTIHVRTPPASFSFDTPEEAAGEFAYASSNSGIGASWSDSEGAGDPPGGGLVVTKTNLGSHTLVGWRKQTFDLRDKTFVGTSLMINPREWNGNNSTNAAVRLGFFAGDNGAAPPAPGSTLFSSTAYRNFYVELVHDASGNNRFALRIWSRAGSSSILASTIQHVPNASALKGNWLRLSGSIIPTAVGSSDFTIAIRLENLGPDGTSPAEELLELEAGLNNSHLAAASAAYAAYEVYQHQNNTGSTYLDNHEATATADVPAVPAALSADLVVKHAFTARWERPANSAVDGYVLEVSTAADNFAEDTLIDEEGATGLGEGIELPASATSLRIRGLNPGTEYVYRVKAVNSLGGGGYSNVIPVTTFDENYNRPPTLDAITSPAHPVAPNSGWYTVNLTGITDGGEGDQTLTFSAVSSNVAAILPPEVIGYDEETGTAQVVFEPDAMEDTVTITVTVDDGWPTNNTVERTFTVIVREQPQFFTFDGNASEWDNEYGKNGTYASYQWGASNGHNGTGGLALADSGNDTSYISIWRKQPYNFVDKTYIRTSIMIRPAGWQEKEDDERVYLGFASRTTPGSISNQQILSNSTADFRGIGVYLSSRVDEGNHFRLRLFNKAASNSATLSGSYTQINNASTLRNNWLRLSVTMIPTGAPGAYTATAMLEDLGTDGLSEPNVLGTRVEVLTNVAISNSSEAYAAYEQVTEEKDTGIVYVDNHEAVVAGGVPNAPTALPATFVVGQAFTTNWAAPGSSSIDGYVLEVSTDENFAENTFVAATGATGQAAGIGLSRTTTSLRLEGLAHGTDYWYRVKAYNDAGDGAYSNTVAVSTYAVGGNAAPTLNPITFPYTRISPRFGPATVNLSGITDGGEGGQTLAITVESDDPTIAYGVVHSYASPAPTGQIRVYAGPATGTATLTVTVSDGHAVNPTFSQQFTVNVQPIPETIEFGTEENWTSEYSSAATRLVSSWGGANGAGSPAGGGLHIDNFDTNDGRSFSAWRPLPYTLAGAEAIRTSILIKPSGWEEKEDREQFFLGFTHRADGGAPAHDDVLRANSNYRAIGVRLASRVEDGQFRLGISSKTGTAAATQYSATGVSGNVAISNAGTLKDNWLRLSVEFTPVGGNQFAGTAKLENLGPNGTSAPVTLHTVTATITNEVLFNSTNAYAAFTSYIDESDDGQIYLDDHFAEVERIPVGPRLTLEQPLGTELTSGSSTVNFGAIAAGGSSTRQFLIRNTGSEGLTNIAAEATGSDAASVTVGAPSKTSLLPGDAAILDVTFANASGGPGPFSATLAVTSEETDSPFQVELMAAGVVVPTSPTPGLSLSANPNVSLGRKLGVPGTDNNRSGGTLAASGNYVVAGSAGGMVSIHNPATGALTRNIAPPAGAGPEFGRSVAVFGNLVAIGSPLEDGTGAVYVFNAATGAQVFRAVPPAGEGGTRFGQSVGLNKDVLAVGDPTATGGGGAYLYDLTWGIFLNYVLPSSSSAGQEFGATLVVDGTQVLVGAPGETGGGAAYLFQIFDSSQIFRIASDDGASGDRFGVSLALDAQRIVAGAPGRYTGQGAAFVFSRSGGTLQQELVASDTVAGDAFGSSVALSAYGVLVGAAEKGAGVAYVFNAASGAEIYRIAATDGAAGDGFGSALAAAGDRILVGAPSHGGGGVQRGGVYRLSFPPYQPDGTVGATAAKLAGRGIHNPSGAGQTLNLVSKKLRKVKGIVTATNDGLATDSLLVRGTAGNKLFKVAYFTASGPRANVTGAMSKGGTVLANLASGEVRHYSVEIAPQKKGLQKKKKNGKKVILKKKYNGRVTLSSQNAPAKTDVVIYRVQTK